MNVFKSIGRAFSRAGFAAKKHSPEILVVTGVAGVVASTVLACRATTKISGILEERKQKLADVTTEIEAENKDYTPEDARKDRIIINTQAGLKLAKLYAPAVGLGILSITAIFASHDLLRKRNVALAAAYAGLSDSFGKYRDRVIEKLGKDADEELRHGIVEREIEETDENGNVTKRKAKVIEDDPLAASPYAREFNETNPCWVNNLDYNLNFLRTTEAYANDKLRAKGYLFLNEVYEDLGLKPTKAGQIVGWVYDEKNPKHNGDNYVDFGIYECNEALEDSYAGTILLDFNVDGNIWELMK